MNALKVYVNTHLGTYLNINNVCIHDFSPIDLFDLSNSIDEVLLGLATHTQGDLTPISLTFSNPILNLNFYIKADPRST